MQKETALAWLAKIPSDRKRVEDKGVWICCPFHKDGKERTPSLKLNLDPSTGVPVGAFFCFACGEHGSWNKIAAKLGLPQVGNNNPENGLYAYGVDGALVNEAMGNAEVATATHHILPNETLTGIWEDDWRGISGKLLKRLGAQHLLNDTYGTERVYIPVHIMGEEVGAVKACPTGESKLKYINTPGEWRKNSLFPYDYTARLIHKYKYNYTILCEGPRDALNLVQYKVPALATLGAGIKPDEKWTSKISTLLNFLGVEKIVLAFDPDEAGNKATKVYKEVLTTVGFKVSRIKFQSKPEKQDPGALSKSAILSLKKRLD